jgi:hypothetical protein
MELLTTNECKQIIIKLSKEFSVPPGLILKHLLNDRDKDDLRLGFLSISSLRASIEVWCDNGMQDLIEQNKDEKYLPDEKILKYRAPFISHDEITCVKDNIS